MTELRGWRRTDATCVRAVGNVRQKLRYGDERFDVELHARLRSDPAPAGIDPLVLSGAGRRPAVP